MISIKIEGGAQLSRILSNLDPGKQRGVLAKMLVEAAEPIRKRMSELAPREPGPPDIADHMVVSPASKIQSPETIGTRSRNEGEAAIAVGPEKGFAYAIPLEFGHVSGPTFVTARPFARPAFDERHLDALKVMQEEIWAYLREQSARSTTSGAL